MFINIIWFALIFSLVGKLTAAFIMVMTHILDIGQAQTKKGKAVCEKPLSLCLGLLGLGLHVCYL